MLDLLRKPPGRQPDARILELSRWFRRLSAPDQAMLADAIALATEQTTYNMLLVLDGALAIESTRDKGELKLIHVTTDRRMRLNDPDGDELTALFKDARAASDLPLVPK